MTETDSMRTILTYPNEFHVDRALALKLKQEQDIHKLTRSDLLKSRTALSFVRNQSQHESKKKDIQLERTLQYWQKLSSDNSRVLNTNVHTGMLVLNPIDPMLKVPRTVSSCIACVSNSLASRNTKIETTLWVYRTRYGILVLMI